MSEQYRGMWIDPRVFERADGSGWVAEVFIAEDDGSDIVDSRFMLKPRFATEDEAIGSALATGRKIVDDKIRGLDIGMLIAEATRLPATHRSAYGSRSDDVASDTGGQATRVPTSGNPDDRFN
jgi:hypothetical protein